MGFTAMNRGQRGKLAMATAALGIGLLSVTGCGYINPQQTTEQYAASDGTQADVGPLQLRNMMIISAGEDKPGRVIGAVYNSSSEDVTLTIAGADGSQTEVPVKQNSYTLLNDSTDEAILSTTGGARDPSSRSHHRGRHQPERQVQGSGTGRDDLRLQAVPAGRQRAHRLGHADVDPVADEQREPLASTQKEGHPVRVPLLLSCALLCRAACRRPGCWSSRLRARTCSPGRGP